ncbi:unnamed protein product [Staurois parvus]|uniref:Uncharacterized protein n=1 Tax=Staurois parvus TaxID=386267 RepID=A0ABN9EWQ4_9NEOB|nr:unnamed protein product [Staurois parvus]
MCLCMKNESWRAESYVAGEGGAVMHFGVCSIHSFRPFRGTSWTLLPDPIDIVCC